MFASIFSNLVVWHVEELQLFHQSRYCYNICSVDFKIVVTHVEMVEVGQDLWLTYCQQPIFFNVVIIYHQVCQKIKVRCVGNCFCSFLLQTVFANGKHSKFANVSRLIDVLGRYASQIIVVDGELAQVAHIRGTNDVFEAIVSNLVLTQIQHRDVAHAISCCDQHDSLWPYLVWSEFEFLQILETAQITQVLSSFLFDLVHIYSYVT